ncbi:S8 family serine peptidase [Sphingomicrobium marinum]|uniref:S8 family serine peptidase n=1 Tax=Sphingomicrobium marinum TaxID=1227950 RepID=UPI0022402300|nr:S8 family serine peptidase [Sphingomicrobium marinum]
MQKILLWAASVSAVAVAAPAVAAPKAIPGQFICQFDDSVSAFEVDRRSDRAVAALGGQKLHAYKHTIRGFAVKLPSENANPQAMLKRNGFSVESCEQDQLATLNFPVKAKAPPPGKGPGGGGDTTPPPQETPWGITRVGGGATYTGGNVAYVLDTGVDFDHEDLNVNVADSVSFVKGDADDYNGHGTHVAGTIAAIDNDRGVIGVAAGATVVSVRVLDRRGSGSYSGIIAGVDHVGAVGNNGDVANLSLGGGKSDALNDAVVAAAAGGINFVLAAGNESTDANTKSPASANGANVYTIASSTSTDGFSSFSNYGQPPIDYIEPGSSILSTYKDGGYATLSGTSMAAPHAAGLLLWGNISNGGSITGPDGDSYTVGVR